MRDFYTQEPMVDGSTKYGIGEKYRADENDVAHLVELKVLGDKPPKGAKANEGGPDYERDDLGKLDLKKANKNQLLVIAAYEQANLPEGDGATVADIVKAIEAKRVAA